MEGSLSRPANHAELLTWAHSRHALYIIMTTVPKKILQVRSLNEVRAFAKVKRATPFRSTLLCLCHGRGSATHGGIPTCCSCICQWYWQSNFRLQVVQL